MEGEYIFSLFIFLVLVVFPCFLVVPKRLRPNETGKIGCDGGLILEFVRVALSR